MSSERPTNDEIADVLDRIADLLETQDANPHRVRAYRNGSASVRGAAQLVAAMVRQGDQTALKELPGVGEGLAAAIRDFVNTGKSGLLDNLETQTSPEDVFTQVPVIGKTLAQRVVEELKINSLQELEQAAHDGRLATVEGFGHKRVEAVKMALAGLLSGAAQRHSARVIPGETADAGMEVEEEAPDVETLLDVDAEYRRKAEAGELKTIAPKRLNPSGEAWLPVLHAKRGAWNFTALFSNTARAHEAGTTRDWVVLYFEQGGREQQVTVVTSNSGPLRGKRVVRGRETECRRYYESTSN
jgi:DNA polymerase (family X)